MDAGLSVSNGSDCPVEPPDVMRGIECAVTRTSIDGTGPYLPEQAFSVKEAIELVRKLYHIRSCARQLPETIGKDRPCLYYQIHQCKAPCQGWISEEAYREQVQQAQEFLNGKTEEVQKDLKNRMKAAAAELRFEEAASLRDLLASVSKISERQKMAHGGGDDSDVLALAMEETDAIVQVFFVRDGKLIGRDHFYLKAAEEETPGGILQSFIQQFSFCRLHGRV